MTSTVRDSPALLSPTGSGRMLLYNAGHIELKPLPQRKKKCLHINIKQRSAPREVPYCRAKRAVLPCQTCHIASQYGTFGYFAVCQALAGGARQAKKPYIRRIATKPKAHARRLADVSRMTSCCGTTSRHTVLSPPILRSSIRQAVAPMRCDWSTMAERRGVT